MNFFVYGLIFIGVGIVQMWRQAKRKGGHVHRCAKCGTEWTHNQPDDGRWPTVAAMAAAHACPKCGAERFKIDRFEVSPKNGKDAVPGGQPSAVPAASPAHEPRPTETADARQPAGAVPVIPPKAKS